MLTLRTIKNLAQKFSWRKTLWVIFIMKGYLIKLLVLWLKDAIKVKKSSRISGSGFWWQENYPHIIVNCSAISLRIFFGKQMSSPFLFCLPRGWSHLQTSSKVLNLDQVLGNLLTLSLKLWRFDSFCIKGSILA